MLRDLYKEPTSRRERKHGETDPHRRTLHLPLAEIERKPTRECKIFSVFLFPRAVSTRMRTRFTVAANFSYKLPLCSLISWRADDVQIAVFHVGWSVRLYVLSSHVFQMARSPLCPVSVFIIRAKQYLNRTGSEEDVTERLFGVSSHSLTPVDSHSWTWGSLINCLSLFVAAFWSN